MWTIKPATTTELWMIDMSAYSIPDISHCCRCYPYNDHMVESNDSRPFQHPQRQEKVTGSNSGPKW